MARRLADEWAASSSAFVAEMHTLAALEAFALIAELEAAEAAPP